MSNIHSAKGWRSAIVRSILFSVAFSSAFVLATDSPAATEACGWNIVSSPNTTQSTNFLSDVDVVTANDIWAVGGSAAGQTGNPLTEHWDGTAWTIVPATQPPNTAASLGAVSALSSNDVWAVGSARRGNGASRTLIEHWNGTQWSVVPSPSLLKIGPYAADNFLIDVVAIAPNDVWAVGAASTIVAGEGLTLHWDGSTWKLVPNPTQNPRFYDANLAGVTALSSNDVWAVGQITTIEEHNVVVHWNGSKWSTVSSPAFNTNVDFMTSVSALSATDIWAVGSFTIPNAEGSPYQNATMHWNGTAWSIVTSPQPDDFLNILTSVTTISANDVWAVGLIGSASGYENPETMHWDGSAWSIVASPAGSLSTELLGVAAVSSTDVWSVGETSNAKKTLIEHLTCQ